MKEKVNNVIENHCPDVGECQWKIKTGKMQEFDHFQNQMGLKWMIWGCLIVEKDVFKVAMSVGEAEKDFFRLVCGIARSEKTFSRL